MSFSRKFIYYYLSGAVAMLFALKILSRPSIEQMVDFWIVFVPFIIILTISVKSYFKYKTYIAASLEKEQQKEIQSQIRKNSVSSIAYFLLITFLFYILYNPKIFHFVIEVLQLAVPLLIIVVVSIRSYFKYKTYLSSSLKEVHEKDIKNQIRKNTLSSIFYLLLITAIFYILYSPQAFLPILETLKYSKQIISLENIFLLLIYLSFFVLLAAAIYLFVKFYHKTKGYPLDVPLKKSFKKTLYVVFFVFFGFFLFSLATYAEAYKPIMDYVSDVIYNIAPKDEDSDKAQNLEQKRVTNLKKALQETYKNLNLSIKESNEKFVTDVTTTKQTLDNSITRVTGALEETITEDIEAKLDKAGGTVSGDLTIEDDLTVESTLYTKDIIPQTDDSYDLGSTSKGFDNLYIHSIHGSSIITIGDGVTSHGLTSSNNLLISGDLEVNGSVYLDGTITIAQALNANNKKIINLAEPTDNQDAANKEYVDNQIGVTAFMQRIGTTISAKTSGDTLDMTNGVILNIGNAGTDFTALGGLTLANQLTVSSGGINITGNSTLTGTLSSITTLTATTLTDGIASLNSGAFTGLTTLTASGAITANSLNSISAATITTLTNTTANLTTIDLGTNTITDTNLTGAWSGITNLTMSGILDLGTNTIADGEINGNWDLNNGVLSNIGVAGTDFNSFGGLTLADQLTVSSGGINITGNSTLTGTLSSITTLTATTLTDGIASLNSGAFTGLASLTVDNLNLNGNTLSATNDSGLALYDNASNGIFVQDGGNVGIGTTSPQSALSILNNTSNETQMITLGGSATYMYKIYRDKTTGTLTFQGKQNGYNNFNFKDDAGSSLLRILENGNIGISTTSPTALLHLNGTAAEVTLEANSNETTAANNILMLRSDVASADDPVFRVQANGAVFADGAYTGTGADYAEYFYTKDTDLKPGEAVCVDITKDNSVIRCKRERDDNLMGVVSSNPSLVGNNILGANANLGEQNQNYKIIGLIGQVDAKITNENGDIRIGDSLTSSSKSGYLMKADYGDSTVGIALENSSNNQGQIKVLISRRNKSLTIEKVEDEITKHIAQMEIEDETKLMIQKQLKETDLAYQKQFSKWNDILDEVISNDDKQNIKLATIENTLNQINSQMDEIREQMNQELNLAQIEINKQSIALIYQMLGIENESADINILGKLTAEEIEVDGVKTGVITIVVSDDKDSLFGEAIIEAESLSVVVKNENIQESSLINITFKSDTNDQVPFISAQKEGEFEVRIKQSFEKDIKFNWWIMQVEE